MQEKLRDVCECEGLTFRILGEFVDALGTDAQVKACTQWLGSNNCYYHFARPYEALCGCPSGKRLLSAYPSVSVTMVYGGTNAKKLITEVTPDATMGALNFQVAIHCDHNVNTYDDAGAKKALQEAIPALRVEAAVDSVVEASTFAEITEKLAEVTECEGLTVACDHDSIRATAMETSGIERAENCAKWLRSNNCYYHIVRAYERICEHPSGKAYLSRYPTITVRVTHGGSNQHKVVTGVLLEEGAGTAQFDLALYCDHAVNTYDDGDVRKLLERQLPMIRVDTAIDKLVESSSREEIQDKLRDVVELPALEVAFDVTTLRALSPEQAEHASAWLRSNNCYYHIVRAYERICEHPSGISLPLSADYTSRGHCDTKNAPPLQPPLDGIRRCGIAGSITVRCTSCQRV